MAVALWVRPWPLAWRGVVLLLVLVHGSQQAFKTAFKDVLEAVQVGGILNANFDQIMMLTKQMGNSMLKEYADVLDTFIYRLGVSQGRFSFAAAAGLFKSIVNFALLLGSNYVAGKFGEAQLF